MDSPTPNLFDRLPARIFRPLGAVEHSRRNWALLCHLYREFFAPEAEPPEGEGWTHKRLTSSIERFLLNWDEGHESEQSDAVAPLSVRANDALQTLLDSEWLTLEREGFLRFIVMRPTVQSLFELLNTFAEEGPDFVGGRVQSIKNNLAQVLNDPHTNANVFQVAAKDCSSLLRMLNTTRMRVKEASEELRKHDMARSFLKHFFDGYISTLYIGDYSELFSRNHPLASRGEIIDFSIQILETQQSRTALREWYRKNLRCTSDDQADELIEADADKIMALRDVDRLLDRLRSAVTRANEEAIGYLDYKLRSQGNFDLWIDQTIMAITRAGSSHPDLDLELDTGWSRGRLLSEEYLRLPAEKPRVRKGAVIQKHSLSPEAQARRLVRQIMKSNRTVSDEQLVRFIERHVSPGDAIMGSDLCITSINDLCIVASFVRFGLIAKRTTAKQSERTRKIGISSPLAQYIAIEFAEGRFENDYLDSPNLKIQLKKTWRPDDGR